MSECAQDSQTRLLLCLSPAAHACTRSERSRLAFGKSAIHGWGLFARTRHAPGAMVIEYRGERVRMAVADIREARYEATGRDCYLLKVDEAHMIDSTVAGNMARFTNHSCNPNMYAKVLTVEGAHHIVFYARAAIAPGEECTYDYRFESEDGRVPCFCGAPNCRGVLC